LCYSEVKNYPTSADIGHAKSSGIFAVVSLSNSIYYDDCKNDEELKALAKECIPELLNKWYEFEEYAIKQYHNSDYFLHDFTYRNQNYKITSRFPAYYHSQNIAFDLNDFFGSGRELLPEDSVVRKRLKKIETELYHRHITPEIIRDVQPLM